MNYHFEPRYNLSLDHYEFDIKQKKIIYRFKVFGDHTFVTFDFASIKGEPSIITNINPIDLIKIVIQEQKQLQMSSLLNIKELLRDNNYKMTDGHIEEIFSGDEICDNPLLFERIRPIDFYKIVYSTGFRHGREVSKSVSKQSKSINSLDNIIHIRVAAE